MSGNHNFLSDRHGVVTLEGDKAYLDVAALMRLLGIDDTLENRNLAAASVCAVLREQGFEYVLVGLDDPPEDPQTLNATPYTPIEYGDEPDD